MIRFACPRCKGVLERPDEVAGTTFACPGCGQKLEAPGSSSPPPENKTVLGNLLDPPRSSALPPPPLPQPYVTPRGASSPAPPTHGGPPPLPSEPPPLRRPPRRDDYDPYDDDDYPPRRRSLREPVSQERLDQITRAAFASFICSLVGLGGLLVSLLIWALSVRGFGPAMGRPRDFDGLFIVLLLVLLVSFICSLLAVVFGSRGMDEANTHNRGMAVGGLVCGIVGLVISAIGLFFFFCIGVLFWSNFR